MLMTPKALIESAKANGGYNQPEFNDQLFLQCKGYGKIQNLEPYINLRALWLDSNAIRDIEGLDTLAKLSALYLNNNCIARISGLDCLTNLHALNLSHNVIGQLGGLRCLPCLETLQITHNRLTHLKDLEELLYCGKLTCVDLSHNPLEKDEGESDDAVIDFFEKMTQLGVLYLTGTEIVKSIRNYRRKMVSRIPALQYLDERPVFPEERRCAEAWASGGDEAEKLERNKIHDEKKESLLRDVRNLQKMAEEKKSIKDKRTEEWKEIQEKEMNMLRKQKEARWDVTKEEEAMRGALDFEEDTDRNNLVEIMGYHKDRLEKEIRETTIRREAERQHELEKKRQMDALKTPLEESRKELLKQVHLWGKDEECYGKPPQHISPENNRNNGNPLGFLGDGEYDSEEAFRRFHEEIQSTLFGGLNIKSGGEEEQSGNHTKVKPLGIHTATNNTNNNNRNTHAAPRPTSAGWKAQVMGNWTPSSGTLSIWEKFDSWESKKSGRNSAK